MLTHSSGHLATSPGKICCGLSEEGKVEGSLDCGYWASKGKRGLWLLRSWRHPDYLQTLLIPSFPTCKKHTIVSPMTTYRVIVEDDLRQGRKGCKIKRITPMFTSTFCFLLVRANIWNQVIWVSLRNCCIQFKSLGTKQAKRFKKTDPSLDPLATCQWTFFHVWVCG